MLKSPADSHQESIVCSMHGLHYDTASHHGCVLCRRSETRKSRMKLVLVGVCALGGLTLACLTTLPVKPQTSQANAKVDDAQAQSSSAIVSPQNVPKAMASSSFRSEHVTFAERHPLSSIKEVQRRAGWANSEIDPIGDNYTPSSESFELVYAPDHHAALSPPGLFVWINADFDGRPHPNFLPLFKSRRLVYAGLNNAGNERMVAVRINLALDAVHAVTQRMAIDPNRIYVGGGSGGGKSASKAALLYPEVFKGGLFVVGADYWRPVSTPDGRVLPVGIRKRSISPEAKDNAFVLISGEYDMNRQVMTAIERAFRADGFNRTMLMIPAGVGHQMPPTKILEAAFVFLDGEGS